MGGEDFASAMNGWLLPVTGQVKFVACSTGRPWPIMDEFSDTGQP